MLRRLASAASATVDPNMSLQAGDALMHGPSKWKYFHQAVAHLRWSGAAFTSAATSATGTAGVPASMSIEDTLESSRIGI